MVRYFYKLTPFVIVGAVVLLSAPWFALIALMVIAVVALAVLAAIAWSVVFVPYTVGRAINRRWHMSEARWHVSDASPGESVWQPAPVHSRASSVVGERKV